ncbi:uncharacterized protein LOC114258145 [Camellia sinensis]|uniref:uncharacterized protein LOC114258145 n=1 Tax=Camellia sinensis TaxID=4442 RepID=UPI001036B419|nr:uncharacterized protein LOC114258145 [Camellia sinensis]
MFLTSNVCFRSRIIFDYMCGNIDWLHRYIIQDLSQLTGLLRTMEEYVNANGSFSKPTRDTRKSPNQFQFSKVKKMQKSARGQLQKIVKEQEKITTELVGQSKSLQELEKELKKKEIQNEKKRLKLQFENIMVL